MEFDLASRETIFESLAPGGVGAEIGVAWGEFATAIFQRAKPKAFYLVDCWEEQSVESYGHDPANTDQMPKYRQCLKQFLSEPKIKVVKAFSLDASPVFPNDFFDWLYIDANHLECHADMQAWWPKVKLGGYMMGHDYVMGGVGDFITVQADVDRFVAKRGLELILSEDEVYKNWIIQKV